MRWWNISNCQHAETYRNIIHLFEWWFDLVCPKGKNNTKISFTRSYIYPEVWFIIIFGYVYVGGFVLYVLLPYDLNYRDRNKRDWHYTTWLIVLPAVIGTSPNFKPLSGVNRMFYGCVLLLAVILFQICFSSIYEFLHLDIPQHQLASFQEIVERNFRLMGSPEAVNFISENQKVRQKINGKIIHLRFHWLQVCQLQNWFLQHLLWHERMHWRAITTRSK